MSGYVIRRVSSLDELRSAFAVLGEQFVPAIPPDDARLDDLVRRFPEDRLLMLVVTEDDRMVGGALGFRSTLRIIGLVEAARGRGLGRRLLQVYEYSAMRHGVREIALGAEEARGFYLKLGYHGCSSMHKQLPLPGRVRDLRLAKLEAGIGDLDRGSRVPTDEGGRVLPLF